MPKRSRQRRLAELSDRLQELSERLEPSEQPAVAAELTAPSRWREAVRILRKTDRLLALRIGRKVVNHLCSLGLDEAQRLLAEADAVDDPSALLGESNVPAPKHALSTSILLGDEPFALAATHLGEAELLRLLRRWIMEERAGAFIRVLGNPRSTLQEIGESLRYHRRSLAAEDLAASICRTVRVLLCQRYLTDQLEFLKVAKDAATTEDFDDLIDRLVLPPESHGKLGGKGAGLLLASWTLDPAETAAVACAITTPSVATDIDLAEVRIPRTWYVASDAVLDFIARNDLEDVMRQKFKDVAEVRSDYPNIIQLFKHSLFSPEIVRGLSVALEDLGERPLIIRSSSLLEDRFGTAFSGKYKSLFLANQGPPERRLEAVLDAIAEIYASVLGPDPIAYRRDRGLLEFDEQMGILIQEVVGRRVGRWFLPAFAGVAFSRNELRWSPRIGREDGLVRLVPGLGTRAVDRIGDDYPTLLVPGQPTLRANVQPDEIARYSAQYVDAIDLDQGAFVTVPLAEMMAAAGADYPALDKVFSILNEGMLQKPVPMFLDPAEQDLIVSFDGLVRETSFLRQIQAILVRLEAGLGHPVDIEFAHDGEHLYLLQCRPQSQGDDAAPAYIPRELPAERVVFSAHRYVTNGTVPDITHVVYVDPDRYAALPDRAAMLATARAVGKLNSVLPARRFILLGPGRWGSRGDITLGVSVTYADISNTAMLIEIGRRRGGHLPELSFGTHFFQDLVEARIRYLPLYPDDTGVVFNTEFLLGAANELAALVPEATALADCIRVIDVPAVTGGQILRVAQNADLDEAVAYLAEPT